MFALDVATYPASPHIEWPRVRYRSDWLSSFLWIRDHTPKDALFALDADYINAPGEDAQCFRAIAERSVLPDYSKDGGEASIAPDLTRAWEAGQAAQRGLSGTPRARWAGSDGVLADAARLDRLVPLGVTWVVMQAGAVTDFACPYGNATLKVCRLR